MEIPPPLKFSTNHIHFEEIGSTNDYLKEHGHELPHGTVVTATRQITGKGRLGRQWQDEGDSVLKMSILLHNTQLNDMPILPSITGIAVCEALNSLFGEHFFIKWPNDIILYKKKVSGILCESRIYGEKSFAVCGIGINLSQDLEYFEKNDLPFATSIAASLNIHPKPQDVYDEIIDLFQECYNLYKENGFSSLLNIFRDKSATIKHSILLQKNGESIECFAEDIGSNGQLLCRIDDSIIEIQAGEASVRGLYGYI